MHSLFRKRNKGKYSPTVQTRSISNKELSDLIEQLQKNADQVERNIVDTEAKMQSDLARMQEGQLPEHRDAALQNVSDSEKLLYVLEADSAIAKHMKHPQGDMIAEDIRQLKERVTNLRGKHKQMYSLAVKEADPRVNWDTLVDEKLDKLSSQSFGTDLPLVDSQVEQHNIFHNEVKAIGPHLAKDKEQNSELQAKYQKLLTASQARQQHLSSLQDYMQRCTNELYWLDQQAKGRMQYDWSDRNLDYPSRRRQYENFINRNLEAKEERINKLHTEGDQLLTAEHPGRNSIEAHMEAVHAEWKEYLNLLICEESHLKYMEDYHQFHKDMKDAQELLRKVDSDLNQKYSPDFKDRYQIELLLRELDDQEKALDKYEDVVRGLQRRGQQVVPLKYRRETPLKPIPVEALCDFESDQGLISRGYSYTLQKNNGESWELTDSTGKKLAAPAVCFIIPPTDPEALALADSLGSQYRSVRQKATGSKHALQQRHEVLRTENPGDASDLQGRQLLAGLDKVASDLDRQEKAITGILRPPLEQGRAIEDSAERAKGLKNITNELLQIEPEKTQCTAECEAFVQALPASGTAPLLKTRVEDTNQKYERLVWLLEAAQEKVDVANRLENSLQRGRELLASYENRLIQDDTMPESGHVLDSKRQELEAMASELQAHKSLLGEVEQNLQVAKQCSSSLASRFQEHCPDLERQEAEVHKLNQRFNNLSQQVERRAQSLQSARAAYDEYCSGYNRVLQFLAKTPSYEPQETDSLGQMETKLKNQKDYELEAEKLRSLLDLENGRNSHVNKRARLQSPAAKVKEEEAALAAKFTEVNAINRQRLQNLEFALNLLRQQPEAGVTHETLQGGKLSSGMEETWKIKKELEEEIERRQQLENEVKSAQEEIQTLKDQGPQESLVRKEVLKKVPDPALEESFQQLQQTLAEEQHKNQLLQEELGALQLRLQALEQETRGAEEQLKSYQSELEALRNRGPQVEVKEVTKEVIKYTTDPETEQELQRLREEIMDKTRLIERCDLEIYQLKQEIQALKDTKPQVQTREVVQEILQFQEDPQTKKEVESLRIQLSEEQKKQVDLEGERASQEEKIKRKEEELAQGKERVVRQEVVQYEDEPDLRAEVTAFTNSIDAELRQIDKLHVELRRLQHRRAELERQLEELERERQARRAAELEVQRLQQRLAALEQEEAKTGEKVTHTQKVVLQQDPQQTREHALLRAQEDEVLQLREELEALRRQKGAREAEVLLLQQRVAALAAEKSRVQEKVTEREVVKLQNDPQLEAEYRRLQEEHQREGTLREKQEES